MPSTRQCENGHYWDPDIYDACPICAGLTCGVDHLSRVPAGATGDITQKPSGMSRRDATVPISPLAPTAPILSQEERTVPAPFFTGEEEAPDEKSASTQPTVGWLVCTQGLYLGQSFTLHPGNNFIGRDEKADIRLTDDSEITAHHHAIIGYDPRDNSFDVSNGENRNNIYLNGSRLRNAEMLAPYDALELGQSVMLFVPFCGDRFDWQNGKKEPTTKE